MSDEYPTVRAAAVQAAPVFLDRDRSVEKACDLIAEAGDNDSDVIVFPEGFVPGHPIWFHYHAATGPVSSRLSVELFKNSVDVPGPVTERFAAAAERADAYLVIGVCEKEPNTTGTMFNSQLFFSPSGELIGRHQKLKPTVGEQLVHAEGNKDAFGAIQTDYGPMSGLICGENSNPLATFALTAEYTRIHAMSWPPCMPDEVNHQSDRILGDSRSFAQVSKAYVVSAAGVVDERTLELLELDDEEADVLQSTGGSVIVAPDREVVAGPLENEEGILYADLDLEKPLYKKIFHDFAGHYNRPDVFQLRVDRDPDRLFVGTGSTTDDTSDASSGRELDPTETGEQESPEESSDEPDSSPSNSPGPHD